MKLKINHLYPVVILVILLVTGCNRTVNPQRYIHKSLAIMDKTALFAEGPLWDESKKRALLSTPETMDEAYGIVREALETAGGKHSFLMERSMLQYNDTAQWRMERQRAREKLSLFAFAEWAMLGHSAHLQPDTPPLIGCSIWETEDAGSMRNR